MKSLIALWERVAHECATWCCTSTTMDCKTVRGRSKHEGLSFLTITLPSFGKDFERSLDQGAVERNLFTAFDRPRGGELPRFLSGFLAQVFDRSSGVLLDDPSVDAISSVRQLTLMYGKMYLPASPRRQKDAMDAYVKCEQEVREADARRSPVDSAAFRRVSRLLFSTTLSRMDRDVYDGVLVPRHGPGSTAEGLMGNQKFSQPTWPRRLERYFSASEYIIPNASYYDALDGVDLLEPGDEIPVKVISVPKTQKAPRIIAKEPVAMQYTQQALRAIFYDYLEATYPDMLGFTDQTPNQRMAREGSLRGNLATLDLSEASDRVSYQHVVLLLSDHPHLLGAVSDCRSTKADVRGHGVIPLAKFASMGSALTFPLEAMVFLTLVFMGIEKALSTTLDRKALLGLRGSVRVYGDDIIVPVEYVHTVVATLESFGIRVNGAKSFWNGKFRESCGKDYYAGTDVTPVRFRQLFPASRRDVTEVISLVSFRNQMYQRGYWQTVRWLDEQITGLIQHFPVVLPTSPVLGRHSFLGYETQRMSKDLHAPVVKGYRIQATLPRNPLDGHAALLKYFLKQDGTPNADEKHLERSGRPHAVNIKLRWAPPY